MRQKARALGKPATGADPAMRAAKAFATSGAGKPT